MNLNSFFYLDDAYCCCFSLYFTVRWRKLSGKLKILLLRIRINDAVPDLAFHFDADPDPTYHFHTDSEPAPSTDQRDTTSTVYLKKKIKSCFYIF
jgi:hypothetical protein